MIGREHIEKVNLLDRQESVQANEMDTGYHEVKQVSKEDAEYAFQHESARKIVDALLGITFFHPDWRWVQEQCLVFLDSPRRDVCNTAITCLGHLARIHGKISKLKVLTALRAKKNEAPEFAGTIEDALDDIQLFVGKKKGKRRQDRNANGRPTRRKNGQRKPVAKKK